MFTIGECGLTYKELGHEGNQQATQSMLASLKPKVAKCEGHEVFYEGRRS